MHLLFSTGHLDLKALLPAPSICCFPLPPRLWRYMRQSCWCIPILPKLWHGQTSRSCNTPSHPVTASVHNTALCYNPPSQQTSLDVVFGETERLMVSRYLLCWSGTNLSDRIYIFCGRAVVGTQFGSPSLTTLALSLTRSSGTPKQPLMIPTILLGSI